MDSKKPRTSFYGRCSNSCSENSELHVAPRTSTSEVKPSLPQSSFYRRRACVRKPRGCLSRGTEEDIERKTTVGSAGSGTPPPPRLSGRAIEQDGLGPLPRAYTVVHNRTAQSRTNGGEGLHEHQQSQQQQQQRQRQQLGNCAESGRASLSVFLSLSLTLFVHSSFAPFF